MRTQAKKLAKAGRRGDTMLSHTTKGEVIVPGHVLDENPNIASALIKAFQKSGVDWRSRIVGTKEGPTNPQTGMEEFYGDSDPAGSDPGSGMGGGPGLGSDAAGPADGGGGVAAGDSDPANLGGDPGVSPGLGTPGVAPGDSDPSMLGGSTPLGPVSSPTTGFQGWLDRQVNNPANVMAAMAGPLSPAVRGMQAVRDQLEGWGANISDDYSGLDAVAAGGRGEEMGISPSQAESLQEQIRKFLRPPAQDAPSFLQLNPAMTDLQRRSNIATYGTQGVNSAYRDPQTQKYYRNLLERAFINDQGGLGDINSLMPIERQYLTETLGLASPNTSQALLDAISRV